ncbi:MAG: NUDIX hydrolase [Candidatus Aenigmarchaeota archaeon]|nr:NUDIX hydrolase [Candidatus Aenigmarchaeota archaeon]MCK5333462.1 NUDIX hydrolase [Candidatus Aenigmarchaeota archaeon]
MARKIIPHLSDKEFSRALNVMPTVVVEVLVKDSTGKILLGRRNTTPFKGMWQFTGGFVYKDEKVSDAAKRIAKREIGIDIKIDKFIGFYEYIKKDPRGHLIALVYSAKEIRGVISPTLDNTELKFFGRPPKNIVSFHKKIFMDALRT